MGSETPGMREALALANDLQRMTMHGPPPVATTMHPAAALVDYATELSDMRRGVASLCADIDRAARGDREGRVPNAPRTTTLGALASVRDLRARWAETDADLAALRIEHEAVCGLLAHTRRDRDEAREAHIQALKDNISLRVSVDVLDGTVAGLKAQRDEARQERDDARDELQRLWGATEADRARPTYEDGVRAGLKAAGQACRLAEIALRANGGVETSAIGARDCMLIIDEIEPDAILAILEPKP